MKKTTPNYIYSIIGISLVLFLLGGLGWIMLNGRSLNQYFKEKIEIQVILHDNTRSENTQKLATILENQDFVARVDVITKEEAAEQFSKEWGEDFTQLLDGNPLYTSINVNLYSEYINPDSLVKVKEFILQSNIVREVSYPTTIVSQLNQNLRKVGLVLGAVALILFVSVVILIDNTVRLAMFSNRLLIKTMQMVGATRWFIARPFDRKAIWTGFISGLIAIAAIFAARYFVLDLFPEINALSGDWEFYVLLAGILILGILISLVSTHRSVFKYLRLKVDDLY